MSAQRPDRSCACQDFNRAELFRRGIAQAGKGLPAIEPGMPTPAGTGLSRRSFVLSSAGLLLSVYGVGRLFDPAIFEAGIAQAATAPNGPVLVSVYLQGGIDSMSVLYPAGDPLYASYRPTLGLAADAGPVFTEDPTLHWNPLAAPFAQLHAEGKVSVLPTIGYSDPNQSHFTSRHYYEVGATDANLLTGWMGRYLDVVGSADNPLQGLCLDYSLQPALATARVPVATIDLPTDYSFSAGGVWGAPPANADVQRVRLAWPRRAKRRRQGDGAVGRSSGHVEHAAPAAAAVSARPGCPGAGAAGQLSECHR